MIANLGSKRGNSRKMRKRGMQLEFGVKDGPDEQEKVAKPGRRE
jgi:hypothetical protein